MCMMNFLKKLDKFLFILRFKNWNSAHFFEVIGRDHKELESIQITRDQVDVDHPLWKEQGVEVDPEQLEMGLDASGIFLALVAYLCILGCKL